MKLSQTMKRFKTEIILAVFMILAVAVVYGQLRTYGFIHYDDLDYVITNRHVQGGLTMEGARWAFATRFHSQWHPLTWLSHMTDYAIFGMHPGRHHLVSLFIHLANTLLLFFFFTRLTGAPVRSAVVAALFALHPLHVEPVAMVADRKDLLSTFFMLLSMHAYVGYLKKGGLFRYSRILVSFVLGIMAKAVIVTLPILLLLLDYWPLSRFGGRDPLPHQSGDGAANALHAYAEKTFPGLLAEKLILFVPMLIGALVAILTRNPDRPLLRLPTAHHIANGLVSYILYIGKALWPVHLAVIYPPPGRFAPWQVLGSGLLLIFITAMVLIGRKKRPYLVAGWGWYLLTLLPVIGLLGFMGPHRMADRYTYVPLVGLFIMAAWGVPELLGRWRPGRAWMPALTGVLGFVMMAAAWIQVGYWQNSLTLFGHAAQVTSGSSAAFNNLGMGYAEQGDLRKAEEQFLKALAFNPDFVPAHLNLGTAYSRQGDLDKAEGHFLEVLRIDPDHAGAHNNLGLVLGQMDRLAEATEHFRQAVQKRPKEAGMLYNLGNALLFQGQPEAAADYLAAAVDARPKFAEAHYALGYALTLLGKPDMAAGHFKEAIRIDPSYAAAIKNLDRTAAFGKTSSEISR
jgi:protein O-mannosyl-transferase